MKVKKLKHPKLKFNGFSVVEALLAIALFALTATIMINSLVYVLEANKTATDLNHGAFLADEGLEIVKGIRNEFFTNLANGQYKIVLTGGKYQLQSGIESIDGYTRQIIIDNTGLDAYTFNITSRVTWPNRTGAIQTYNVETQLTDWHRTIITGGSWLTPNILQDFNLPGRGNVYDLEIAYPYLYVLSKSSQELIIYDITSSSNITQISSLNLFTGTKAMKRSGNTLYFASASNSNEFFVVDITNPYSPQLGKKFNLKGSNNGVDLFINGNTLFYLRNYTTNSFFININKTHKYTIYVYDISSPLEPVQIATHLYNTDGPIRIGYSQGYLYTTTSNKKEEILISQYSGGTITDTGFINLPGNTHATGLLINDNRMYIGTSNGKIYIYDLTSPETPSLIGSYNWSSEVNNFALNGNLLFISTHNSKDFLILNIANPSSPTFHSSLALPGKAEDVVYSPDLDRAFVGTTSKNHELIVLQP